jgi:hypothetical protein
VPNTWGFLIEKLLETDKNVVYLLGFSEIGYGNDKPDPATARSGRANAMISPSRWYKKSVRP